MLGGSSDAMSGNYGYSHDLEALEGKCRRSLWLVDAWRNKYFDLLQSERVDVLRLSEFMPHANRGSDFSLKLESTHPDIKLP